MLSSPPVVNPLRDAALSYASRGWFVLPCYAPSPGKGCACRLGARCPSPGKHPLLEHGLKDASIQPMAIYAWWKEWPTANVAVRTGAGLLVIDVDRRNGGEDSLASLEREHGALPMSVRTITGNGFHVYLSAPLGRRFRGTLAEGIEAKWDGGYVMAPPSLHHSGRSYTHDAGSDDAIAAAPAWVLEVLSRELSVSRTAIPGSDARDTLLGEAFAVAGMLGHHVGEGKWSVRCPWVHEHTPAPDGTRTGDGNDSSTVIMPPTTAARVGGFCCLHSHCTARGFTDVIRALPVDAVEAGKKKYKPFVAAPPPGSVSTDTRDADPRPSVTVTTDLFATVDQAVALLPLDPGVYERDGLLVTVLRAKGLAKKKGPIEDAAPVVRELSSPSLADRLSRLAVFRKFSAKTKEHAPCAVPSSTVAATLARGEWPDVPPLVAITEAPILRPDGSIHQTPGYDPVTGYLLAPSTAYPAIPDHPTQDHARAALAELVEVFKDFPFVSDAARMVPVACVLSLLARPAIDGAVPGFVFEASTRGSGKSLQSDVVSQIVTGRYAARANYSDDEDEQQKILSSYALFGSPFICLDNVPIGQTFGGGAIDRTLTARDTVEFRLLGESKIVRLRWRSVLCANGNNLTLGEDTSRRVLVSRLEPDEERPEQRPREAFLHPDLVRWVRAERGRLVAAGLTVLRAYFAKGCPDASVTPWGSFDEWNRLVPGAIVFAGGANPCDARPASDAQYSDEGAARAALLAGIARTTLAGRFTVRDLLALLFPAPSTPDMLSPLRDALLVLCPTKDDKPPAPKRAGEVLRATCGRHVGGFTLRVAGVDHSGARVWVVRKSG